jgi:Negative regulator of sigma F
MTVLERDREPLPAALREALRRDFAPVTPLSPPWRRSFALALPTLVVLSTAILLLSWRGGTPGVLTLSRGGVSVLEWLAGFCLLWLALREAVPGLGFGAVRSMLALAGGVGLQLVLGVLLWQRSGAGLAGPGAFAAGAQCATIGGVIGLPHLAIATWLALSALPIRPRWSGALAGAAAGLLADGTWHLACSRNDLEHLLVWHLGATVLMMLVGAISGSFWTRWTRSIG